MLKPIGKKILPILHSKILCILTYAVDLQCMKHKEALARLQAHLRICWLPEDMLVHVLAYNISSFL